MSIRGGPGRPGLRHGKGEHASMMPTRKEGGDNDMESNGRLTTSLAMGGTPYRLLKGIAALGSLNKAAREMKMSYSPLAVRPQPVRGGGGLPAHREEDGRGIGRRVLAHGRGQEVRQAVRAVPQRGGGRVRRIVPARPKGRRAGKKRCSPWPRRKNPTGS